MFYLFLFSFSISLLRNLFAGEKKILLFMTSPFISRSWLNNHITGISYSGCFKNQSNAGKQAIDNLLNCGLLTSGQFLVNSKKDTLAKTSPLMIRSNASLLDNINMLGINIDQYEEAYGSFALPFKINLNRNGIDFILNDTSFIPFYHLFMNQLDFHEHLQQQIAQGLIEEVHVDNKKKFILSKNIHSEYFLMQTS